MERRPRAPQNVRLKLSHPPKLCHPERSEAPAERSRKPALSEAERDLVFLDVHYRP
jgi:hypothetical protein